MTIQELSEKAVQLSLKERLELLEVITHSIRQTLLEEEADNEDVDIVEGFREGWADAMEGRTHPISTLWDDIDAE